jgi:hypothetical protein
MVQGHLATCSIDRLIERNIILDVDTRSIRLGNDNQALIPYELDKTRKINLADEIMGLRCHHLLH